MADGAGPWGLLVGASLLGISLVALLPGAPPPQSRAVHRVDVVMRKAPEALPGSGALAAAFPEVAALAPDQRLALAVALGMTDAPCEPCAGPDPRPLSVCALDAPRGCENLPALVRRAARAASEGLTGNPLREVVAYGDVWIPAAVPTAAGGALGVELWVDPASPGLAKILEIVDQLQGVEIHPRLVIPGEGAAWAALGLGAEADGRLLDLLRCWATQGRGAPLDAPACDALPLDAWRSGGAELLVSERTRRADEVAARGLRSSPTWFVGGYRARGLQSADALQRLVDRERALTSGLAE